MPDTSAEFDQFAGDYDAALNRGISLSGECKDYFIERRVDWTARCLAKLNAPRTNIVVMDYGAGTGSAFPKLRETFKTQRLLGVDVSTAELAVAKKDHPWSEVFTLEQTATAGIENTVDLAYSNGTFHHIPPEHRAGALALVHRSLKPGGLFALWENNPPGTPATRWVHEPHPTSTKTPSPSPPSKPSSASAPPASKSSAPTSFSSSPKMLAPLRGPSNRSSPASPWAPSTRSSAANRDVALASCQ